MRSSRPASEAQHDQHRQRDDAPDERRALAEDGSAEHRTDHQQHRDIRGPEPGGGPDARDAEHAERDGEHDDRRDRDRESLHPRHSEQLAHGRLLSGGRPARREITWHKPTIRLIGGPVDSLPIWLLLTIFVVAAAVVWVSGVQLPADRRALDPAAPRRRPSAALILLAVATNLPEIAITVSAAISGDLGVAVGNILGGIAHPDRRAGRPRRLRRAGAAAADLPGGVARPRRSRARWSWPCSPSSSSAASCRAA